MDDSCFLDGLYFFVANDASTGLEVWKLAPTSLTLVPALGPVAQLGLALGLLAAALVSATRRRR